MVMAMACVVGCGVPIDKTGPPVRLPSHPAQTACEKAGWSELVPARMTATGETAGVLVTTHYQAQVDGTAVFRADDDEPVELEELWPEMGEPKVAAKHQARIEPVDQAQRNSLYWVLGGVGGMGLGLGTAAIIQDESESAAAVAGITGLAIGLVGVIGALVAQPSGPDQVEADARRYMFIPGEDDPEAVKRGVDRLNQTRRRQCEAGQVSSSVVGGDVGSW